MWVVNLILKFTTKLVVNLECGGKLCIFAENNSYKYGTPKYNRAMEIFATSFRDGHFKVAE